jgi:hypothetical protein
MQWPLSCLTLVGVVVSSLSVLTWTVQNTQLQCDLRLWAWVLGSACMFLPLVSAFLRIHLILVNTTLKSAPSATAVDALWQRLARSSGAVLAGGQLLLFAIFFVLTLAWHLVAPLRLTIYAVDAIRPLFNVHECATSGWTTFGAAIAAFMLAIFLLIGGVSWSIRRVQDTRFHRFRVVMMASLVCVLFLGVTAVFQSTSSASTSRTFLFGMRSFLVLLSNLIYLVLLFASPLHDAMGHAADANAAAAVDRPLKLTRMSSLPHSVQKVPTAQVPAPVSSADSLAVVMHLPASDDRASGERERDPPPTCI